MRAVVIVSGGMDSTTLLYWAIEELGHDNVNALSFDYGQRHRKELICAEMICKYLQIPWKVVDIRSYREIAKSSLTRDSIAVPHGKYNEETMKATVSPARNMVMLSYAIAYAIYLKSDVVYYGAHSGDHTIYPDCRPGFVHAMSEAAIRADWHRVEVQAPFIACDKYDILKIGQRLKVPYEFTWTCYEGGEKACGKCGSCHERLEAFERLGIPDPIEYNSEA